MEMSARIDPNTYSFVTKDGYAHMAVMMEEGKYKGVAWGYTKINIPKEEGASAKLTFSYEILDNGGMPWEDVNEEDGTAIEFNKTILKEFSEDVDFVKGVLDAFKAFYGNAQSGN